MAMYAVTRMLLQQGCEVKVLAVNSPKCHIRKEDVPATLLGRTRMEWVYIDTSLHAGAALHALLRNRSYHAVRFHSPDMEARIAALLQAEEFDIIHIESIFPAVYLPVIRRYSRAKVVIRAHNMEHRIWERVASHTANPLKRAYLRLLSKQLKTYELDALRQADGIAAISRIDAENFRRMGVSTPMEVIPFGICPPETAETPATTPLNLFSIASMNWQPNTEGLQWFAKRCWPLIHARFPQLECLLAGRHFPQDFLHPLPQGLRVVGEVEDAGAFMRENGILIVPLLSGSGVRIKILEGMSYAKPIITTSIGAEGIDVTDKQNILLADTPEAFLDAVSHCMVHPEQCRRMGEAARAFVCQAHDERRIAERLSAFYQSLLSTKNQ